MMIELFQSKQYVHMVKKKESGGWFNKKMPSYQYRKSHCGDKTILRPSYLHNGISYTGKMTSLYWIGAQKIMFITYLKNKSLWYDTEFNKFVFHHKSDMIHDVILCWICWIQYHGSSANERWYYIATWNARNLIISCGLHEFWWQDLLEIILSLQWNHSEIYEDIHPTFTPISILIRVETICYENIYHHLFIIFHDDDEMIIHHVHCQNNMLHNQGYAEAAFWGHLAHWNQECPQSVWL